MNRFLVSTAAGRGRAAWRSPSCRLPDDATKAKAAETAAKAAWQAKVDAYQLCKAQDKVAAQYMKTSGKTAAKETKPAARACRAASCCGRVGHTCCRGAVAAMR